MSSEPLSIRQTFQTSQKDEVKDWIGRMVVSLMPSRAVQLYKKPETDPVTFADKAIMFHLRRRAISENRSGFLERVHQSFWASEKGAEFSENCDHRFHDLFIGKQQEDFQKLQKVWNLVQPQHLVEIGANSGLLLEHLTTKLPKVIDAVGIDINPEQILRNQKSDKFDPRIEFLCTDGRKWVLENGKSSTLFVTNGGVLEYFPREKLDEMMSHISDSCSPSVFYASEPVAHDHNFETNVDSIPFGEEHSFSHNYKDLFESNGFTVVHQRAVIYDSWKMMATIAVAGV